MSATPPISDRIVVARVPNGTAFEDTGRDPAPFRYLGIGRAYPVDRHRRQAAFFPVAGETQPAVAVLRRNRTAGSRMRATVAQHPLFDQENRVLDGGASLHSAPLD